MSLHGIIRLGTFAAMCLLLGACDSVPHATPTMARSSGSTPQAHGFLIDIDLTNDGKTDIPLDAYEYVFAVDGFGSFHGRWAAMRVLPPESTITVSIPAVLPANTGLSDNLWTIKGDVEYQAPGILGQILFDLGIQRPTVGFSGSGALLAAEPE